MSDPVKSPRILVVGSINMDLVVRSSRLPVRGETISGNSLREIPGGKGANQAVGAARLGSGVKMIGRVGDDAFAATLMRGLLDAGIDTTAVAATADCSSGVAIIGVEDSGQNCITVVPGANGRLTPHDISAHESLFAESDVMLVQLEIPLETVEASVNLARNHGLKVIFDPAPAVGHLPAALFHVDVVCPNETEASLLTGMQVASIDDAAQAAQKLIELGAATAIVTLGHQGVVIAERIGATCHIPGFSIDAIDTTAAGDAFAAALAVRLAMGEPIAVASRFACAAAAVSTSRAGAQPGMPSQSDVAEFFNGLPPGT